MLIFVIFLKILVVEPNNNPYVKDIEKGYKSLQNEVSGYIEVVYPFEDQVALICNEEGKLMSMPLNRALYDETGKIYDIIAGTFLVVGLSEDDFTDLSDELIQKFKQHFKNPEQFIKMNGQIISIPIE